MSRILLGVSGGIAAYKALELARLATRAGHSVRVLMTPSATRFVGQASFEAISGAPVLVDEFERDPARGAFPGETPPAHDPIGHLAVVANADVFLIAPASANTLAKLAAGLGDNMLTAAFLACKAPTAVAPAMNDQMWAHPATRANVELLRSRGVRVIEPESGALASRGEHGVGRLPDPPRLLTEVEALVPSGPLPWDGLSVLVTAGGTREPIDSVRFVGNRSSGRMGMALASRASARGARVTVVAANVAVPSPPGVELIEVRTAAELGAATRAGFAKCHVLLMAAAVADFRPAAPSEGKISKSGQQGLDLRLEPTEDVLTALAAERKTGQTIVGFAAEHGAGGLERAREKLVRKGLDAIVVNDVSRTDIGFESERNEVTIVEPDGTHHLGPAAKDEIAEAILERVDALRRAPSPQGRST